MESVLYAYKLIFQRVGNSDICCIEQEVDKSDLSIISLSNNKRSVGGSI